jgi:hypothetical protein
LYRDDGGARYGDLITLYAEASARAACGLCAPPVVVSSDAMQEAPEPSLRALCEALGIPFDSASASAAARRPRRVLPRRPAATRARLSTRTNDSSRSISQLKAHRR